MDEKKRYLSQIREILARINLFKNFNEEQLDKIIELAEFKKYDMGDLIIKENSVGNELFVLLEGGVVIYKVSEKGVRIDLTDLAAGDFFGELSLFDGKPRSASVETKNPSNLLVFTKEHLVAFTRIYPEIIFEVVSELGSRLRFLNERFVEEVVESQEETSTRARRTAILEMMVGMDELFGKSVRSQNKKIEELEACAESEKVTPKVLTLIKSLGENHREMHLQTRSLNKLIGLLSKRELFNFANEIDLVLNLLYETYQGKVDIVRDFRDLSNVTASRDLMNQVIKIIIKNAIDSIDDRGIISVSTHRESDFVNFTVEDNGNQIEKGVADKIFEIGFSTRERSETYGVNLWLARSIVRWHGGDITLTANANKKKFIVKIPA